MQAVSAEGDDDVVRAARRGGLLGRVDVGADVDLGLEAVGPQCLDDPLAGCQGAPGAGCRIDDEQPASGGQGGVVGQVHGSTLVARRCEFDSRLQVTVRVTGESAGVSSAQAAIAASLA